MLTESGPDQMNKMNAIMINSNFAKSNGGVSWSKIAIDGEKIKCYYINNTNLLEIAKKNFWELINMFICEYKNSPDNSSAVTKNPKTSVAQCIHCRHQGRLTIIMTQ